MQYYYRIIYNTSDEDVLRRAPDGPRLSTAHIYSMATEIVSRDLRNIINLGKLRRRCRIKVCSGGSWRVKKLDKLDSRSRSGAVTVGRWGIILNIPIWIVSLWPIVVVVWRGILLLKKYSGKSEAGKTINTRESNNNKVHDKGLIGLS